MSGSLMSLVGTSSAFQKITVNELLKVTSIVSGSTLATTTNGLIMTSGRIYLVFLSWDPTGAGTPTVTLSDTVNTYNALLTAITQPNPITTSGTGVITQVFATTAGATANRTLTATFSASITAKTMTIVELIGATTTQRNTSTVSRGTTSAPSYTTPSGNQYDVIFSLIAQETNIAGQPTAGSTNNTGGTWSTVSNNFTTGGTSTNNIGIAYQYKLLNTAGSQTATFTMGSTSNWAAQSFVLQAA